LAALPAASARPYSSKGHVQRHMSLRGSDYAQGPRARSMRKDHAQGLRARTTRSRICHREAGETRCGLDTGCASAPVFNKSQSLLLFLTNLNLLFFWTQDEPLLLTAASGRAQLMLRHRWTCWLASWLQPCREQGHTLTAASCSFDFRIMAPCQLPFSICAECMCRAGPSGQRESQQPCVGHALMYSMHARWTNAAQAWAFWVKHTKPNAFFDISLEAYQWPHEGIDSHCPAPQASTKAGMRDLQ